MPTNTFRSSPTAFAGAAFTVTALASLLLVACGGGQDAQQQQQAEVGVAKPVTRMLTDWDEYTGRLEAVESVEVRARVSGYLQSVHFRDGALVDEGDLLFVIDPRPYRATLEEAKAALTGAEVRLELARNDLERAQRLYQSRAISEEELDARTQQQREAVAALEEAQAAVQAAGLNLEFTRVSAPISGRIGRKLVTDGNLVSGGTANSTLLTTIVSLDPIHAYFTADERAYLRYVRLSREGARPSSRDAANPVRMQLADEEGFPHVGYMDFVNNEIDEETGTMQGRAIFDNPDGLLIPGLFGRVQLLGRGPYEALLVPEAAIATDQSQRFVWVLDENDAAVRRRLELGRREGSLRVVRSGLEPDDRVVVEGLQRVRPGATLAPRPAEIEEVGDPDASREATAGVTAGS